MSRAGLTGKGCGLDVVFTSDGGNTAFRNTPKDALLISSIRLVFRWRPYEVKVRRSGRGDDVCHVNDLRTGHPVHSERSRSCTCGHYPTQVKV